MYAAHAIVLDAITDAAANDCLALSARAEMEPRLASEPRFNSQNQIPRDIHVHDDNPLDGGNPERTDYITAGGMSIARARKGQGIYFDHSDLVHFLPAKIARLGSPVAQTYKSNGAVATRTRYTPFGLAMDDPNLLKDQAGFTGHIKDSATGLNYMQARYYDPVIGRFLSIDPVTFLDTGNPAHINRYAYANNDPANMIDPDGNIAITFGPELQGSVAGLGGGVSVKRARSFSNVPGSRFKFRSQSGYVVTGQAGAATIGLKDPNASFLDKAKNFVGGVLLDTGASAMLEVGIVIGTENNPADVEDLHGNSVQAGFTISKKKVTKHIPGTAGQVADRFPGPELSFQMTTADAGNGESFKGIEIGGGVAVGNPVVKSRVGTTLDGADSAVLGLKEEQYGF